jgi:hypothetical protein
MSDGTVARKVAVHLGDLTLCDVTISFALRARKPQPEPLQFLSYVTVPLKVYEHAAGELGAQNRGLEWQGGA